MKTKILTTTLVLVLSCAMAIGQSTSSTNKKMSSATKMEMAKDSVYYTCPMHHDVKMSKPGKCPTCGMALQKKTMKMTGTNNQKMEAMKTYTCSMHPEVISDKPGKCPKCGMALIVKK